MLLFETLPSAGSPEELKAQGKPRAVNQCRTTTLQRAEGQDDFLSGHQVNEGTRLDVHRPLSKKLKLPGGFGGGGVRKAKMATFLLECSTDSL